MPFRFLSAPSILILLVLWIVAERGHSQDLSFLGESADYLWPTESSPYISSTFGETRAAHFHAGLDIRTWGREGYKVFATRDGVVYRIGISPWGYGKVITLKHEDGSFSMYAHLNRFESSIMAVADSIRMRDYRFVMDEVVEDLNIRVSRGDVIAYTGSTGAGPPHLHFELRTPENEPFNPLLTNLRVEDTLPPVFTGLGIEHLDPVRYHVKRLETRRPQTTSGIIDFGTVESNGPVGLSVNVHDRANRTPNIYAVYQLTLTNNQDTLFTSRVDAYSYEDATQMFIDRVYPLLRERRQGFQRLYLVNGNQLPFYETGPTRGVVDLPEGEHHLRIVAEDFYRNRSEATITLRITNRHGQPATAIRSIPAYASDIELTGIPGGRIQSHEVPVFTFNGINGQGAITRNGSGPLATEPEIQPRLYYSREETMRRVAKKLTPDKRQFLNLPDQSVWVEFPKGALFDTLYTELSVSMRDDLPVIRFSPDNAPLRRPAKVNLILQHNLKGDMPVGIFGFEPGRPRGRFLGKGYPGEVIRAEIRAFQEVRLLYDETPPSIGSPRIHRDLGGTSVVSVPARDDLSGIDYTKSRIIVNGEPGITEYDPDRHRIIYYRPGFIPQQNNRVEVTLVDWMGNQVERTFPSVSAN